VTDGEGGPGLRSLSLLKPKVKIRGIGKAELTPHLSASDASFIGSVASRNPEMIKFPLRDDSQHKLNAHIAASQLHSLTQLRT
jgi:hypothetical protein